MIVVTIPMKILSNFYHTQRKLLLPYFRPLLLEEPDDDDVTHHHCQESCTVDAEDGDEELDWKFGDAEHHRRLVRRADHGGHGAGNEE